MQDERVWPNCDSLKERCCSCLKATHTHTRTRRGWSWHNTQGHGWEREREREREREKRVCGCVSEWGGQSLLAFWGAIWENTPTCIHSESWPACAMTEVSNWDTTQTADSVFIIFHTNLVKLQNYHSAFYFEPISLSSQLLVDTKKKTQVG